MELRTFLGEEAISTDDEDLHRHGFSEWSSVNADALPVAVAYPKTTEDVAKIAKICHQARIPMSLCSVPHSKNAVLIGTSPLFWWDES